MVRLFRAFSLFLLNALQSTIIRAILDSTREHWRQASLWAFSNVVGSFMPIWGAFFLLRLHRIDFRWVDFARHGEFGLYAAALLAPSVYQILKNIRRDRFPLKAGAVLLALAGILMAAFIYAGTNPQFGAMAGSSQPLDEDYLMKISGCLLGFAFVFSFFVMLIENVITDPDLGMADQVNQAFLNAAVSLGGPQTRTAVDDFAEFPPTEPIPSNADLGTKFDARRAKEDPND